MYYRRIQAPVLPRWERPRLPFPLLYSLLPSRSLPSIYRRRIFTFSSGCKYVPFSPFHLFLLPLSRPFSSAKRSSFPQVHVEGLESAVSLPNRVWSDASAENAFFYVYIPKWPLLSADNSFTTMADSICYPKIFIRSCGGTGAWHSLGIRPNTTGDKIPPCTFKPL